MHTQEFNTLTLRGETYTFRALDLDQIEELEPQFGLIGGIKGGESLPKESLQALAEIALASLQHRHAGLDVKQVRKLITLGTIPAVMDAIRGVNQLQPPEGEALAAQ